jgi:hypothetical protein
VASRWVRAEATLADRRNKLVPAIIEACDRPIVFELTHTAELSDWHGDRLDSRWRSFVDDLNRLIQAAPHQPAIPPLEASTAQPVNRQPLRPGSNEVISAEPYRRDPAPRTESHPAAAEQQPLSGELHCLEIEDEQLPDDLIVIEGSGVKIGRSAPAEVVVSHGSISREHCIVGIANDELLVTDLNSTNGTYIDDVRITRATILPVGSVLRLGKVSLRHAVHTQAEAQRRLVNSSGQGGLRSQRVAATS